PGWFAWPDVSTLALIVVPLAVFLAYAIFGATGFGSSIVAVPLLAHVFPLSFAVPLVTVLDTFAATSASIRQREHVAWPEFVRLLPALLVGMAIGSTLLINLPRTPAIFALGLFVTLYGSYLLRGPAALVRAPVWLAWPIGIVGGVFSALFGTGGPIYIVFLSARIHDKTRLRATSALVVTVSVWIRFALFIATGLLLNAPVFMLAALGLPAMIVGLKLGNRMHHALSGRGVLRLIAALLLLNGVTLVWRALADWRLT
ncbi:MAG TPA: sulfite exporter TauE/SafE family protein, partial [Casimicrobiaceae bacterium]|nr:sulfite exporter TauE/SafE family protein [Casimicrobiaceae bacterium]